MVTCEDCGREFKNTQGLSGHQRMWCAGPVQLSAGEQCEACNTKDMKLALQSQDLREWERELSMAQARVKELEGTHHTVAQALQHAWHCHICSGELGRYNAEVTVRVLQELKPKTALEQEISRLARDV